MPDLTSFLGFSSRHRAHGRLAWVGAGMFCALLLTALLSLNRSFGTQQWSLWHDLQLRRAPRPPPLPEAPLLTPEEAAAGVTHYGPGTALRRVAGKLLAGQPIAAVTLGGSITFGHGVDDPALSYPQLFFRFINTSFPHSGHVLSNQGQPGSTSQVVTPCVGSMVAQDVDLVVVEFSANDSPSAFASPAKRSYEALLRTLLALPGGPAVALLHHYPWWKAAGEGASQGVFYREPEGQLTTFAHYYGLPSLSMRAATWRLMQAGVPGFKVDRVLSPGNHNAETGEEIPAADPQRQGDYFYLDTIHPGPNGHQVLAELLAALLRQAVAEAAASHAPSSTSTSSSRGGGSRRGGGGGWAAAAPRPAGWRGGRPPPMTPGYEHSRSSLCKQMEAFEGVVVAQRGFAYRPEKPLLPTWVEQKWGWTASQPGAWAELEVDTRAPPGAPRPRRTTLLLSHLKSGSAGMGTAAVACVGGCSCPATTLDGTTPSHVTVLKIHAFRVSRHPRCRIRVTVTPMAGATPQAGHKVMLAGVMVTHQLG